MKLRKKIALFITCVSLVGLGVTYLFVQLILLNRFDKLDEANLHNTLHDIVASYNDELQMMKTSLVNYSMWDDTYQFVTTASPKVDHAQQPYILSNYDKTTYETNNFHMIALLNKYGDTVYGGTYNSSQDDNVSPLPAEYYRLFSQIRSDPPATNPTWDSISGIVLLDEGPMLITYLPIVKSNNTGTMQGIAIAGRMIDDDEIKRIGRLSPLGIKLTPVTPGLLEESKGQTTWTSSRTEHLLTIHTHIADVFGNPGIVLTIDQPREIYQSGLQSIRSFRLVFFSITLITSIAIVIYVNRSILQRMASLNRKIRSISSSQDLSIRIVSTAKDEFSDIEHEFNAMISSLQSAQESLQLQAKLDPLTQLPNRTLFFTRLSEEIEKAKQNNSQIALLFIDIDNFKTVNDTWGHDYGDAILKEISRRITCAVGDSNLTSRLGGDEFTILLADIRKKDDITFHLQKIQEALSAPHKIHGQLLYSTASIGVSVYPENGKDAEFLVKQADLAMFHVKETGRNNFFQYSDILEESVRRKKVLRQQLLSAIDNQELEVHYQPILSAGELGIRKVEALLRWSSPTYGAIPPSEFIPLAETNGSIVNIGRWVFQQVCRDLRSFNDQGLSLRAAVNISAMQLMQPYLLNELLEAVKNNGLTPFSLELEITESVLMSGDSFFTSLQKLREHGFRISLDDFGTGFSSLSYLRRFPVDVIKIDRSFISEITHSQSDDTLVKAIIELSHNLGLLVVSEGIELKLQFDMLLSLGSDELQGYYISKPLNASEIISFLSQDTPFYDK
ncbi:putative bifunctional diguanylate cyclase/phosphodiesterase [Paenibacillus wynnii]|uniref:putative bifunctional diguanylate cyclase/phosphodiesterase n=1 Tax=Paenibacillus wynnii TaxID=268407 RepID=UPI0027942411|nr:EAL domain-containing protein [Paenibacillus wynnii]MDQ0192306.1 diguanylate cyclase (GGDEF)-like protein [Paenibacillus wynnii]